MWAKRAANVLRERRLQWFGHVERRYETEPLGKMRNFTLTGRRPRGCPRTWVNNMEDKLVSMNLRRKTAKARNMWRSTIARLTSHK